MSLCSSSVKQEMGNRRHLDMLFIRLLYRSFTRNKNNCIPRVFIITKKAACSTNNFETKLKQIKRHSQKGRQIKIT